MLLIAGLFLTEDCQLRIAICQLAFVPCLLIFSCIPPTAYCQLSFINFPGTNPVNPKIRFILVQTTACSLPTCFFANCLLPFACLSYYY
jgi:hypothetical protein